MPASGTVNITNSFFSFYLGATLNRETCTGLRTGNEVSVTTGTFSFPISAMPKKMVLDDHSAYLLADEAGSNLNLVQCIEVQNLTGNVNGTTGYSLNHLLVFNEQCLLGDQACRALSSGYEEVIFQ